MGCCLLGIHGVVLLQPPGARFVVIARLDIPLALLPAVFPDPASAQAPASTRRAVLNSRRIGVSLAPAEGRSSAAGGGCSHWWAQGQRCFHASVPGSVREVSLSAGSSRNASRARQSRAFGWTGYPQGAPRLQADALRRVSCEREAPAPSCPTLMAKQAAHRLEASLHCAGHGLLQSWGSTAAGEL